MIKQCTHIFTSIKPHEFLFAQFMGSMYDIFAIVTLCAEFCYVELCYDRAQLNINIYVPMHFVMAMLIVKTDRSVALHIETYGVELA